MSKALEELQDYRDLAHEENMKIESQLAFHKADRTGLKSKISQIQAELTRQKFLQSKLLSENDKMTRSIDDNHEMKKVLRSKGRQGTSKVLQDASLQLDELQDLKSQMALRKQGKVNVLSKGLQSEINQRMRSMVHVLEASHQTTKAELDAYYEEEEKLGTQIENDENQSQNLRSHLALEKKRVVDKNTEIGDFIDDYDL